MNRNSIRWQLPFSYALTALLAALALGSVMLLVLSNYYAGQERAYLYSNAEGLKPVIEQMLRAGMTQQALNEQVRTMAFFSQTQIRLLDENGRPIADSGLPDYSQNLVISGANTSGGGTVISFRVPVTQTFNGSLVGPSTTISNGGVAIFDQIAPEAPISSSLGIGVADTYLPLSASPYGYVFASSVNSDPSQRSSQSVSLELESARLELSHGPAYGAEIVRSVSLAWLAASIVAVILAVLAGWLVSRQFIRPVVALTEATRQMERGGLGVRASLPVQGTAGEFLELAHAFNGMAQRVEDTISTLRAFVSDAAHELYTPLTALHTNLELAANAQQDMDRELFLQRAVEQNLRLEQLTTNLLDLSRIEAAQGAPPQAIFDLREMVRETGERFASRAEQAERHFNLNTPAEPVQFHGSALQIQRVVDNLLENSLKFTPAGGSISLDLENQDGQIIIRVMDTGIGIAPEDLPHLFERFHRGRNAAGFPGNGLGLAIVKAIVDAHQGRVWAKNSDTGACFEVVLTA